MYVKKVYLAGRGTMVRGLFEYNETLIPCALLSMKGSSCSASCPLDVFENYQNLGIFRE
jgi:hypothetical protein